MYPVCSLDWQGGCKGRERSSYSLQKWGAGTLGYQWGNMDCFSLLWKIVKKHQISPSFKASAERMWTVPTSFCENVIPTSELMKKWPGNSTGSPKVSFYTVLSKWAVLLLRWRVLLPTVLMSPELFWDCLTKLRKDCNRNDLSKKRFVTQEVELRGS